MRNLVSVCVQPGSIVSQAEFHGDGILVSRNVDTCLCAIMGGHVGYMNRHRGAEHPP